MPQPLRPLLAAVSSTLINKPSVPPLPRPPQDRAALPFVTVSREAGAGGRALMSAMIERMRKLEPDSPPWAGYDHQLLEKVAERHGVDARFLEKLESDEPRWLIEVFETLGPHLEHEPSPPQIYRKVVQTIRQLARDGRCVIVGRGAAMATADMPGGVHVRLVAPMDSRVANLAEQRHMSAAHAEAEMLRLDRARDRFFKRYWGIDPLGPEHFHLTLNTARLTEVQLVDAIFAALPARQRAQPTPAPAAMAEAS